MTFAAFMASTVGRGLRALVGIVLLILAFVVGGAGGWILGILGVFFVLVGAMNVCVLAPLFGGPLRGADVRH